MGNGVSGERERQREGRREGGREGGREEGGMHDLERVRVWGME